MNPMSGLYSEKSSEEVAQERQETATRVAEIQALLSSMPRSDPRRAALVIELQQITPHLRELNKELNRRKSASRSHERASVGVQVHEEIERSFISREDLFAAFAMHALLVSRGEAHTLDDEALASQAWDIAGWMEDVGEDS